MNGRRPRRRFLTWAVAIILAGALAWGLRPRPSPVETARASMGPLRVTVSEQGKTRIRQRYVVSAPVSGLLRRIPYKPGATIEAGRTVAAVIEPAPSSPLDPRSRALAEARRDAAAEVLQQAHAGHELSRAELERVRRMFEGGVVSAQALDNARAQETAAAREVAAAAGSLQQAQAELEAASTVDAEGRAAPIEVHSPVSGSVLHVFQESTRVVAQGTPLIEIGDPSDLEVVIEMLSRDGAAIGPGTPVELEQWGGAKPLDARVRLVEPAAFTKYSALGVEEQRVNVIANITSPPDLWKSLGDGFRVEARVVLWSADRVLKVPASALFRHGEGWALFVLRGGRALLTSVQAGHTSGVETEILGGLSPGDQVILYPGDRVSDNQRVEPTRVTN